MSDITNKKLSSILGSIKSNDISNSIFVMSLVLYGGLARPSLPENVMKLFDNPILRIIILSLIMWNTNGNPMLSIGLSVIFVIGLNLLLGKGIFEKFEIIEPQTNILPGCLGLKLKDLLDLFGGDEVELEKALRVIGTPFNIPRDDANAPLLATYLINYGYKLNEQCQLPPK